jgi:orotidine-5'-phosphate decarboxylase
MKAGSRPRVFVALDFDDAAAALSLAGLLDPRECGVKIGSELFTVAGPELVRAMVERRFKFSWISNFTTFPIPSGARAQRPRGWACG